MTLEDARTDTVRRLQSRESAFISSLRHLIYAHRGSPYRALLQHAGCELGDVERMVTADGLEATLSTLATNGAYVTFDEMKGRAPAVRGSRTFSFTGRDFDNPLARPHFAVYSGGSRGAATRVPRTLALVAEIAAELALVLEANQLTRPRFAYWMAGAYNRLMVTGKLGMETAGWFFPIKPLPRRVTLGAAYIRLLGRLGGVYYPMPGYLPIEQPERMAHWLAQQARHGPIVFNSVASSAARVAQSALDAGLDLSHVTFYATSEPVTAERRRPIDRLGSRVTVTYGSTEVQIVGYGCPDGEGADDLHFFSNRVALVQRRRELFQGGPELDALALTSLSLNANKVCLNAETGDYARVETRDCGCSLGAIGLRTHLSEIRSFEKLSTEGTTFAHSNLQSVLERTLPAHFGGSSLDYQLVEDHDQSGRTRLELRIHPTVGPVDEAVARQVFLTSLASDGLVAQYHTALLDRLQSIVIVRQPPVVSPTGKILPFGLATARHR